MNGFGSSGNFGSEQMPDFDRLNLCEQKNFGILYDYFAPRLWRHVLIRTSSPEESDDILGKIFLKTWEYLRSGRRVRNIRGFLYKTADNLVIDFYRGRAAASVRFADFSAIIDGEAAVSPAVEERMNAAYDLKRALAEIQRLEDDDRKLLTLRFVDGLELGEIARIAGKSKGATAVAVHRALKKLREQLAPDV